MPAKSTRFSGNRNTAIALIVVCIVGTAILIAARSSEPTAAATPAKAAAPAAPAAAPAPAVVNAKAEKPSAKSQSGEAADAPTPATIEGCLVQDDETFRLKNTSGEDAPKGRSWKSGFLHKGSRPVEILDARNRLNLARHVGERVSVSGMLEDRELRASSLKRVAESCD